MLKTYTTYNSNVWFSKYKFYNKLLGGIILLRVTPSITLKSYTFYFFIQDRISTIAYSKCICGWSSFPETLTQALTPHTSQTLILVKWPPHQGYAVVSYTFSKLLDLSRSNNKLKKKKNTH